MVERPIECDAGRPESGTEGDARATTLALLARRPAGATVCPSEVARLLAAAAETGDWRAEMACVHDAIDRLLADGRVRLSWKGKDKPARDGPYRIAQVVPESGAVSDR